MRQVRRVSLLLAVVGITLLAEMAQAAMYPLLSLRELTVRADLIVVAVPVDTPDFSRFRVVEVLKGSCIKFGDEICIDGALLTSLGKPCYGLGENEKQEAYEAVKGLFFLRRRTANGGRFRTVTSGIRYLTKDNKVLSPYQYGNPGPVHMVPPEDAPVADWFKELRRKLDWQTMLSKVRADVAEVNEALALKGIKDPVERNRALFDWIADHCGEFRRDRFGKEVWGTSWGPLEDWVFEWIMESFVIEDCWKAVELHAELNPGSSSGPDADISPFACPEGRKLLLDMSLNVARPAVERRCALYWMRSSLWPYPRRERPAHIKYVDRDEQLVITNGLVSLLQAGDEKIRRAALWALYDACRSPSGVDTGFDTEEVVLALVAAYQSEPPGKLRNSLANAIAGTVSKELWEELTGNPRGILVVIDDFVLNEGRASFSLNMENTWERVFECPALVLERVDDSNKVVENRQIPLPVTYLPKPWEEGWFGDGTQHAAVSFPDAGLTQGRWRLTVEGTAGKGKEKVSWTSEHWVFEIPEREEGTKQSPEETPPGTAGLPEREKAEKEQEAETEKVSITGQSKQEREGRFASERQIMKEEGIGWFLIGVVASCAAAAAMVLLVLRRRR